MTDAPAPGPDYSQTLFLPKTDFPMRAGLPQKEPEILARWARENLYAALREAGRGRPKFVLHDGPPYANGNIHIGHSLNKILKDLVVRAQQMSGKDSNYVPGWDCHGLPIEWRVEEEHYRKKGKTKPDFSDPEALIAFRRECRAYAEHWIDVQREEFKRLGVVGDWDHPYLTMSYPAEAQIAREIFKFVANGLLYRGSKPVMWSVVEKTALAEAEIEYEEHTSDTVYVAFPVEGENASVVIWTTTPWTLPGNRAIAFSRRISYGRYRVTQAPDGNWAKVGATYILAQSLAPKVFEDAKVEAYEFLGEVGAEALGAMVCAHPLQRLGYGFVVPLLDGDHVTEDAGTGFVHTAPGHGREDFELWMANGRVLTERGVDTRIPYTVDEDGALTEEAPGFEGRRVITDKGEKGDANEAVIKALVAVGRLVSRGRLKHQYPHSWRSKKPVIFRNTPQWFLAMDRPFAAAPRGQSLRAVALDAIKETRWVPAAGENRITGMVASKPDWVLSRQRAWGVPLSIFVRKGEHEVLYDPEVNARIADAFEREGADAWFAEGAKERFLGAAHNPEDYEKIDNLVEVWFELGLDARLRARRRQAFSWPRRHQAPNRGRRRRGDVSRRLRPASRLVPVLAARELRHARPRALRRRADARLHARREGPEDVEVARQSDLSARGDQGLGRRHIEIVGGERRLCGRSTHRPRNPEDGVRQLPQIAQHGPLDARHARPLRPGRRGRLRRDGRNRAADAAPPRRTR